MLKISDQLNKLLSKYLFLKTKLLRNEKIAFKLTDSNQTSFSTICNHYSGPSVHILSTGVSKSNLKASWFISNSLSFSKGFLSMSPQKSLPLTPSFFLLHNLQIRLNQSFTVFCMCCHSCTNTTRDTKLLHDF